MPVAIGGYYAFGGDVNANVVLSLPEGPMRMSVEILIMMHLFFAIIIVFNPVAQHFEDIFNIEHGKKIIQISAKLKCYNGFKNDLTNLTIHKLHEHTWI